MYIFNFYIIGYRKNHYYWVTEQVEKQSNQQKNSTDFLIFYESFHTITVYLLRFHYLTLTSASAVEGRFGVLCKKQFYISMSSMYAYVITLSLIRTCSLNCWPFDIAVLHRRPVIADLPLWIPHVVVVRRPLSLLFIL